MAAGALARTRAHEAVSGRLSGARAAVLGLWVCAFTLLPVVSLPQQCVAARSTPSRCRGDGTGGPGVRDGLRGAAAVARAAFAANVPDQPLSTA